MNKLLVRSIILVITISFCITDAYTQCLPGWTYYREVIVDHSSGTDDLTDFQIRVDVNTGDLVTNNKLKSDASDLRAFDKNCNPLHFYVDSAASSNANSIWVKHPFVAAGTIDTIYLYYGNNWASDISSGDSTFLFFDDFEDGIVDYNKWETVGAIDTVIESNGEMEFRSTQWMGGSSPRWKYIRPTVAFDSLVNIEFSVTMSNSAFFGFVSDQNPLDRYGFRVWTAGIFDSLTTITILDTTSNGFVLFTDYPWVEFYRNAQQNIRFKVKVNNNDLFEVQEIMNYTTNSTNSTIKEFPSFTLNSFSLYFSTFSSSQNQMRTGYVKFRKAVEGNEPVTSLGTEYMNITTDLSELSDNTIQIHPNPVSQELWISHNLKDIERIEIFDMMGKLVDSSLQPNENYINVSSLNNGIYFLRIVGRQDHKLYTARFTKN